MRDLFLGAALLLGAGCKDNVLGWWDLELWEVERDGTTISRADAGFVAWGDSDYGGGFEMGLSYVYDYVTFDLVPDPTPTVGEGSGTEADDIEYTPVGEPDLTISVGDEYIAVPFDIVEHTSTALDLETVTPLPDGSMWHWRLRR